MNYYQILEVSKNATQEEIRESYKTLIKKYHPDIYKGDKKTAEKITSSLNEAYDVLSAPEKRAEYDLSIFPPEEPKNIYYVVKEVKPEPESFNQKFKKKVYNYVDEHTQTLTYKSKITLVLGIIFIAFLLTLISLSDYLRIIDMKKKNDQMIRELYYQNMINNYNTIYENNVTQENIVQDNTVQDNIIQYNTIQNNEVQNTLRTENTTPNNLEANITISNNIKVN